VAHALLLACALAPSAAAGQVPREPPGPVAPPGIDTQMVETAPIRCWWRSSTGAVAIGEPFDVRLTCAVLETDTVQVVPDETRLTVAGVQLKPFEVVGGDHPADTRAGQRRFFQYRYTLRLLDPAEIGQDVSLPRLPITYKVQSRVAADATLAGRDFAYLMPGLSLHVLSQVPEDASDIRDGADVGLERVEALQFRARLFDIAAWALAATGALLGLFAAIALVRRSGPAQARERPRAPDRRVLAAASAELSRVAREAAGGWTPELVSAGHAALRVVSAMAIGRGVSEQPLPPGVPAPDGRIAVRARIPGRPGVAVSSATTTADLARALATTPPDSPAAERAGLDALHDALKAFTGTQYASGESAPDAVSLAGALDAGRAEAARLARERLWRWLRRGRSPREWREGAARP
jgi:hypothetical protein